MTLVEICVDDVDGARTAERCGADRIELCADLLEGGITPSLGMVATTLATLRRAGLQILIRPRGGDFVYDADELAVMRADIAAFRALPSVVPVGFVLSGLTPDARIDRALISALMTECAGAPVTFSRAFDDIADQATALETLVELGVGRILTGGGPGEAAANMDQLADLVGQAAGRIGVLAAGTVRSRNVAELVADTGVREVHLRAPVEVDGRARTSADEVRAVIDAVACTA